MQSRSKKTRLLALLAYEPVLFMVIMAVGINGSFLISEVPPGLLERRRRVPGKHDFIL